MKLRCDRHGLSFYGHGTSNGFQTTLRGALLILIGALRLLSGCNPQDEVFVFVCKSDRERALNICLVRLSNGVCLVTPINLE